jgi:hypothetical protein
MEKRMWESRKKRINAAGNAVYDIYRDDRFVATVEVRVDALGGMRVLLGALQPLGKRLALGAIEAAAA